MLSVEYYLREHMTPEELIQCVKTAPPVSKTFLALFLNPLKRPDYLSARVNIERELTKNCVRRVNEGDTCLEGGCPIDKCENCLEAILIAEPKYSTGCVNEWLNLFEDPANRIDEWK